MGSSHDVYAITRCLSYILKKVRVENYKTPGSIKLCKNCGFRHQYSWRTTTIHYKDHYNCKTFSRKSHFLKWEYNIEHSHVVYAITRCLSCILKKVRVKNSKTPGSIKLCKCLRAPWAGQIISLWTQHRL